MHKTHSTCPPPFHRNLPARLGIPYHVCWLLAAAAPLAVFALLLERDAGLKLRLGIPLIAALETAYIPIGIVYAYRQLSQLDGILKRVMHEPPAAILRWCHSEVRSVFSRRSICVAGVIFAGGFVLSVGWLSRWWTYPETWYNSVSSRVFFTCALAVASFVGGNGVWVVLRTALLAARLSRIDLHVVVSQPTWLGLKDIARIYVRLALLIAGAHAILISGVLLSPLHVSSLLVLWLTVLSLLLLAFFVIPVVQIHGSMAAAKRQQICESAESLRIAADSARAAPTAENITRLREMMAIQDSISKFPEWPLDLRVATNLVGAILIPLLMLLIQAREVIARVF
jgi:hypothetical protein